MRGLRGTLAVACAMALWLATPPGAGATSYPDSPTGTFDVNPAFGIPIAVDVDSSSGDIYVAGFSFTPNEISRFDSAGNPLSPAAMGNGFNIGVAVEQGGDHTVYAYDFATKGVSAFTSAGAAVGSPFPFTAPTPETALSIGSDAQGNIYVPTETTVNKYTSAAVAGTPASFECTGAQCNSTALNNPLDVAVDSSGRVYVADSGNERVIRFDSDGSNPIVFSSGSAGSVAVDTSTDEVYVGGNEGSVYHVTVYDPAGNEVDDFGSLAGEPSFPPKIAVSSSTHTVYVPQFVGGARSVFVFDPLPAPTATTGTASAMTATTATLGGSVNPNEVETDECRFDYTTKADFEANSWANADTAACAPAPLNASSPVAVSGSATGMTPSSEYVFRVVEKTAGGTAEGSSAEFSTLAPKPTVTTEAATGISQTGATLNGKVDAEGNDASCTFQYGTTSSYGQSAPCSVNPVTGTTATSVSAVLSGLSAGTTYHYRVVATNGGGEGKGLDMTLTTSAAPTPPSGGGGGGGSSTPPPVTTTPPPPVTKKPLKCKKGFKKKTVKGKAKCVKVKKKHKKH